MCGVDVSKKKNRYPLSGKDSFQPSFATIKTTTPHSYEHFKFKTTKMMRHVGMKRKKYRNKEYFHVFFNVFTLVPRIMRGQFS